MRTCHYEGFEALQVHLTDQTLLESLLSAPDLSVSYQR